MPRPDCSHPMASGVRPDDGRRAEAATAAPTGSCPPVEGVTDGVQDASPGTRGLQGDGARAVVALARCSGYDRLAVEAAVGAVLDASGWRPARGARVLVKPNLLRFQPGGLCCTHPEVVRAACVWLQAHDVHVTVGDSPAFGTAQGVAARIGLADALAPLGLAVIQLDGPRQVEVADGGGGTTTIGVSRHALDADAILSVPRLKAHCQMRVTCAVKNLFGCVCGVRKALAHTTHGADTRVFGGLVADIFAALPPVAALCDAVTCMHVTGPAGGEPFGLGLMGASVSPAALDAVCCSVIGLDPSVVPLWGEMRRRGFPGTDPADMDYPLEGPSAFDGRGFVVPGVLKDVSFAPGVLLRSLCRRVLSSLRG